MQKKTRFNSTRYARELFIRNYFEIFEKTPQLRCNFLLFNANQSAIHNNLDIYIEIKQKSIQSTNRRTEKPF